MHVNGKLTDDELNNAINQIGSIKGVRSTTLISKKDAEKIFKSQFGEDILDLVGFNPLPASCVVNVEKEGVENLEILPIIKRLEMLPVVDEIKYQSGDIKKIKTLCRIDTKNELEYYKNGGILQYVLMNMI